MKDLENVLIFLSVTDCTVIMVYIMFHNEPGFSFLLLKNRRPVEKSSSWSVEGVMEVRSPRWCFRMRVRSQRQWNLKHPFVLCVHGAVLFLLRIWSTEKRKTMAPAWGSACDEVSFQKKDLESSSQRAIPSLLEPNRMNVHLKSDRAIETLHFAPFFISHWSVLLKLYTWIKCVSILKRYNNTL